MKLSLKAGTTSKSIALFIQDSSSTTGGGLTGLVFNSATITAYYWREGGTATSITLQTLAAVNSAYASGGFKEVDATNMPGWYRLDLPDAAIAASAKWVGVHLKGATNMAPLPIEIELTAVDNQDSVRYGLTALPNATAGASTGLPLSADASGRVDVIKINGTSQTARDIGASVLLSTGTGTGQLDFTSGVVKANAVQLLGTAWLTPGTAGTPDVNAKLIGATTQTGRDIGASVLLSTGTGTGQLDFTSGVVKGNVTQWSGTTVATPFTAGVPVTDNRTVLRSSTAQATGNSTTAIKLDASASATTDFYKGHRITVVSGTGSVQSAICTAYDGSTKIATVAPAWPTAPDNTSVFVVEANAQSDLETIVGAAVSTTTAQLGVNAVKLGNTTQTGRDIGTSVLLSAGTGTGQLDFTSGVVKANVTQLLGTAWLTPGVAGTPDVNAKQIGATAQTGRDIGASVLLSAGTGTGQLDFTSGVVKANAVQLLGTAWLTPGVAGTPDVNAKQIGATAQTGRDLGASVLLSSGTGTGQLDFTSGVVKGNVTQFGGSAGTFASGRPEVNATHAAGTAWNSGGITSSTFASGALNAVWSFAHEGSETVQSLLRLMRSVLVGKASGMATTTAVFRDAADTKARVTATVDSDGNRSAITTDAT